MKRFYVDKICGAKAYITNEEHRHLSVVLRMAVGDRVIVCCGDGMDYTASISAITKTQTTVQILSSQQNLMNPRTKLTLFLALPKADRFELVVQKCVELGVHSIVPFVSKFCTATALNPQRNARIALEASKQCGRNAIAEVLPLQTFAQMIERIKQCEKVFFPYECATECGFREALEGFEGEEVALVIGSEGGFDPDEAGQIVEAGGIAVTLGHRILRVETAAIATVSAVMYAMGEWRR